MTYCGLTMDSSALAFTNDSWQPDVPSAAVFEELDVAPEWLAAARQAIRAMLRREQGWDSYRARPIDADSAEVAVALLRSVVGLNRPPSAIGANVCGHVELHWHTEDRSLELEALPDGSFAYVRIDEGPAGSDREGVTRLLERAAGLIAEL